MLMGVQLWTNACEAAEHEPARPHLTFVMADDLGANDVGWSDPTVLSPTIDALGTLGHEHSITSYCIVTNELSPVGLLLPLT